jgi:hypothetical protein
MPVIAHDHADRRMVVDRAIASVEDQLQDRVWVRIVGAGTHLHRQEQKGNEP